MSEEEKEAEIPLATALSLSLRTIPESSRGIEALRIEIEIRILCREFWPYFDCIAKPFHEVKSHAFRASAVRHVGDVYGLRHFISPSICKRLQRGLTTGRSGCTADLLSALTP
jgi:hypothetical protein